MPKRIRRDSKPEPVDMTLNKLDQRVVQAEKQLEIMEDVRAHAESVRDLYAAVSEGDWRFHSPSLSKVIDLPITIRNEINSLLLEYVDGQLKP